MDDQHVTAPCKTPNHFRNQLFLTLFNLSGELGSKRGGGGWISIWIWRLLFMLTSRFEGGGGGKIHHLSARHAM